MADRTAGMFIRVDIDAAVQDDMQLCQRLVEVCPVDIFQTVGESNVATVDENLDECTLCDLCMQEAPGLVQVVKLYREGEERLAGDARQ